MNDSLPTGAPQGSGLTIPLGRDPLATYDPATRRIRAMRPDEQNSFAAQQPSGPAAPGLASQMFSRAAAAQDADPANPQTVQEQNLLVEHPSAFAALRGARTRSSFPRPRKPGRFGK